MKYRSAFSSAIVLKTLLFVSVPTASWAQSKSYDPDEGTLSSAKPRIPEPMVFDLIRPLGAKRGEFEVNSLFRIQPLNRPGRLLWAPEVEYAFLDGYGLEFELPLENAGIDSYKVAIQGTLPGPIPKKFIQGWQAIAETASSMEVPQLDILYLAGARWNQRWSTFSMTGLRRETDSKPGLAFLGNYTLFYHDRAERSYGLETNYKGPGSSGKSFLLMPQIQLRGNRINVQLGSGWNWRSGANGFQLGWRISREF